MVDRFEDPNVKLLGLGRVEGHAKSKEGICQALDTDADGTMAHVAVVSFFDRIVIDVDDLVQVANNRLGNFVELLEVVFAIVHVDERRKSERCKVADSNFVGGGVFDDFATEIRAADSAEVFLVALPVAVVFVEHEGIASLGLGLQDCVPKFLGPNGLTSATFFLIAADQLA